MPTATVATGAAAKNFDAEDHPHLLKLYAVTHVATDHMLHSFVREANLPACTHYSWVKTNGRKRGGTHLECKYDAIAISGRGAPLLVSLKGSGLQL